MASESVFLNDDSPPDAIVEFQAKQNYSNRHDSTRQDKHRCKQIDSHKKDPKEDSKIEAKSTSSFAM